MLMYNIFTLLRPFYSKFWDDDLCEVLSLVRRVRFCVVYVEEVMMRLIDVGERGERFIKNMAVVMLHIHKVA